MDSVRSEYSDSSSAMGTSRFTSGGGMGGGGGGGGSSSVSFVDSASLNSSRASTTRSDFLSTFEQKFLERKTETTKKREREKRLADASTNQLTADDKRRADREAERLMRKAEMATWLPTTDALHAIERDRKKRSRDKMRDVLRWYPPLEAADGPAHAQLVGTTPASLRENRKRHTEIQPLFLPASPHAQDVQRAQQQQRLRAQIETDASELQRRVMDLQQKMACVERLHAARGRASMAVSSTRRLAPLATTTQSLTALPSYSKTLGSTRRSNHAISTSYLFREAPYDAALARVRDAAELDQFLNTHKRHRRRAYAAVTIQATWRMVRARRRFHKWQGWRTRTRRAWFQLWALSFRISQHAQRAAKRKCFRAWRDDVAGVVRLRLLELRLFREAESQPGDVAKIVRNLVFMADDDDDAYTRKVLAHPMKQSYYTGFVNAAFASVEQRAHGTSAHRVRLMRAQHLEARRAVAKKIVQRLFLLWKQVHADNQRVGLNAQLCIKRAARQAFQKRPMWAGEKLLTIFELWARYAAFARSKRLRVPLPQFARPLPFWDVWLHNYQERQIRAVKATARAPLARMRRCFRGVRAFATMVIHKRVALEKAMRQFRLKTTHAVLRAWREAIAADATRKKWLRAILSQWWTYATRKHRMRPWTQQVRSMRQHSGQQRAWRAWRNVQVRSVFTRELHCSRLLVQPQWRWKVQRLLLVWMDLRAPLRKHQCFVAWKHTVEKRKLFLTLRQHCEVLRRKHVVYGVFSAWKAVVWKQEDGYLEDRLRLSAWDAYRELAPLLPMLFYGHFSDAAAIFAGVSSAAEPTVSVPLVEDKEDVVDTRQREIRAFHAALLQGSVVEARNLILNRRHLLNGVDDLTGNTALHVVAGQVEDPLRRVEITTLLLSEGACAQDKPNRHGLLPTQLATDDSTRRLLERGVYAFHADGVLQRARALKEGAGGGEGFAATRLVWGLVARMTSEYVRGDRLASDVHREWHSELRDERWLRRGRVCFASASAFAPTIHRCRAFLNGMKRRIHRPKHDELVDLWTRVQNGESDRLPSGATAIRPRLIKSATRRRLGRDLARMEEKIDLLSWLKHAPDDPTQHHEIREEPEEVEAEQVRIRYTAQSLGEYSAYAEAVVSPVLQDEAAERDLVHSFVGVLFSLAFPVEVVLAEAARLEDECTNQETDVLQSYRAILGAELRCRSPVQPHGLPLVRYFSEASDAEFFFKRELLLLNMALYRRPHDEQREEEKPDRPTRAELQLDADVLLAKAQRKQRKVSKKVAASTQHVALLADANTRVLLTVSIEPTPQRLRAICDARIRLEEARLRLANLRLKQLDWTAKVSEILTIKQSLDTPENVDTVTTLNDPVENELLARRIFLREQLQLYTQELQSIVSSSASTTVSTPSTTELRRLHKAASTALWGLFVKNLFRTCFCWLAENLLNDQHTQHVDHGDSIHQDEETVDEEEDPVVGEDGVTTEAVRTGKRISGVTVSEPLTTFVANSLAAAQKPSTETVIRLPVASGRRRSSLSNVRPTLDTMERSAEAIEMQTHLMRETYASSSHLLFESDRDAMQANEMWTTQGEMELPHQSRCNGAIQSAVVERNPITGLPETPSSRLLATGEITAMDDALTLAATGKNSKKEMTHKRNRKRELMRRAMAQRQLQRLAAGPTGPDFADDTSQAPESRLGKQWLPLVDGVVHYDGDADLGFGNFVIGSDAPSASPDGSPQLLLPIVPTTDAIVAAALAESLWKRGGTVRRPHEVPSATNAPSPASSGTARGPDSFELFASAEDEKAFNATFRVISASKERRTTPSATLTRRVSAIGAVAGSCLDAVSPREDEEEGQADQEPRGEERDVVMVTAEAFDGCLVVEEADASGAVDTMGDVTQEDDPPPIAEVVEDVESDHPDDESEHASQPEMRVLSELASLVTTTDETAFFDQTLQQYLERVRRDSFVGPRDLSESAVDDLEDSPAEPIATEASEPIPEISLPMAVDGDEDDGNANSIDQVQTPHIRWEPSAEEQRPPRPLHVESLRLLAPVVATTPPPSDAPSQRENAILLATLRELERREADERQRQELQNQPFLLSGTTSVMAARQRKSSVPSTLLKRDTSTTTVKLIVPIADDSTVTHAVDTREETYNLQVDTVKDKPASPSIPKIMVAIQRRGSNSEEPTRSDSVPNAAVPPVAKTDKMSSPTRRLSQQKPLTMAHCDVRLDTGNTRKTSAPKINPTSRRRTSRVEVAPSGVSPSLQKQPSRLAVASSVAFCLEGMSALGGGAAPGANDHPPTAAIDTLTPSLVPQLTEEQKRNVWREFTAAPLSDTMQDAYAQLYPGLYAPVTPLPSAAVIPPLMDARRSSGDVTIAATATASASAGLSVQQQILLDKRFWSAVEGFKAVGNATLVPLDEKTIAQRRIEAAVAIYQQFLSAVAPSRPVWLSMYSDELRAVERRLLTAPRTLFDALQQTAQLHISTLQSQQ